LIIEVDLEPGSPPPADRTTRTIPLAARYLIAVMRSVPTLLALSLCALGAVWLAGGRTTAGLALIAAAGGATTFGVQIAVASRFEARNRGLGTRRTELARDS
jgi:hypothetical protein